MLYMSCERVLQMRLLGDGALRDALELRRVKLAIGKNIAKNIDTFSYIDHFVGCMKVCTARHYVAFCSPGDPN